MLVALHPMTKAGFMPETPTLSQTQIIRALADALSWFEREITWGVSPSEMRALTGRIGELYAAMITRGQMALASNQRGYDVVSAEGHRISVKTITSSSHVSFRTSTFGEVDRVLILRVNVDPEEGISIEELLDKPAAEARALCREAEGLFRYLIGHPDNSGDNVERGDLRITARATYEGYEIVRYENAAIRILRDGVPLDINVKGFLRPIALDLGLPLERDSGVRLNTQQLGANVIRALCDRAEVEDPEGDVIVADFRQASSELAANSEVLEFGSDRVPERRRRSENVDAPESLRVLERAHYGDFEIVRYENLAIGILRLGMPQNINVKGFLRPIANELSLPLFNKFGTPLNTRQLGAEVIRALIAKTPSGRAS
ncbi:hypothetical protein ACN6KF_005522 [Labrys sp. La1]|uniref:DUF6998 domain-containing protein n=1 Tax=Labrys sp. La1 TaxID=3404917 RepID=UPI003EBD5FE6